MPHREECIAGAQCTAEFDDWIANIKDGITCIRLAKRLDKVQRGLLGNIGPVGEGVWEMCEFFGPDWRD